MPDTKIKERRIIKNNKRINTKQMNILKMTPEEKLKIQEEHKLLEKQEQDRKNELKKGLQKPEPKTPKAP